ncbi:MAG: hypothetical protein IH621_07820, partial [Krumholzibacteria bacterium]|nr:hypothetical protein [Candidatus Krumholzibacteria bacterium]
MSNLQQADALGVLVGVAHDLTASLAAEDRYERLLTAVRRLVPCDAACLLRLVGQDLVPVAGHGLSLEALNRRYARGEHPRLDILLAAAEPSTVDSDDLITVPAHQRKKAKPRALPADLPRAEVVHDLSEADKT